MKKIQGAYPTLEETVDKVDQLLKEGHRTDNITVVAQKEKIEAIHTETLADVDAITTNENQPSVWEKVKNVFSSENEADDPLRKYGFDEEPTERYNTAIKNGEYVILIDDDTDQPVPNEESQPITGAPAGNAVVPGFGVNPVVPGVGVKPGGINDDSSDETPGDPDLPNVGDRPKNN